MACILGDIFPPRDRPIRIVQGNLMAASEVNVLRQSGLNDFLFADIGVEANGMTLSVVSLLARQGIDPWQEAGRLAGMTKADAVASLAQIIVGMPQSLWNRAEAVLIAGRLVDLLPSRLVRAEAGAASFTASWRFPAPRTIALICLSISAGYAISLLLR
jgi:hypothetical protein